jgi:hypothetical protein
MAQKSGAVDGAVERSTKVEMKWGICAFENRGEFELAA